MKKCPRGGGGEGGLGICKDRKADPMSGQYVPKAGRLQRAI